jgi:hypothetical protein
MTNRLAALAAVTLVLAATAGCNETDDPGQAENVILVTGVTTSGLSFTCGSGDTIATISFSLNPRGGSPTDPATTFFHDVTLTSYSVAFEPAVIPSGTGAISTGYCIAGSSCTVDLVLVPDCTKPAMNTTVIARIDVEGRDVNDNPVNFDVTVPLTFTP